MRQCSSFERFPCPKRFKLCRTAAAEKTSCHNKPFEAIQTSNDCLQRNVPQRSRAVTWWIRPQNDPCSEARIFLARLAGWSLLRNLKILGNWHLVTLSSDPLTNLNCFMRYVFRRKRFNFLPPWNWVGLGAAELLLFSYFDLRRRPVCAQVSSKLFSRLCSSNLVA